jgi:phosphate transport system protein
MTVHFMRDMESLKKELLVVGSMVENAVNKSIGALVNRRPELAQEVVDSDDFIDDKELEVEEQCLKTLALHQPVAADLRFVIAVLKVNSDLERMGDYAVHIAERAEYLSSGPVLNIPTDYFNEMVKRVQTMVRKVLDALITRDSNEAREVVEIDDEVDELHWRFFDILMNLAREDPSSVERAFHTLSASRHLERIGDLATNIAEDIVFMVEGEVIRHKAK